MLETHDAFEQKFLGLLDQQASLPAFTQRILDRYYDLSSTIDADKRLVASLLQLAEVIDQWGQKLAKLDLEPRYHNRQHAREVLLAMVLLLHTQDSDKTQSPWPDKQWPYFQLHDQLLMLIAALGHDFLHPGSVNTFPHELERQSAHGVEAIMLDHEVGSDDIDFVKTLILATEFEFVQGLHSRLINPPSNGEIDRTLRASILVTEADILPSVLPSHGQILAQQLAQEWQMAKVVGREDPSLPQTRTKFLTRVRFSSPHASRLGIPQLIQSQL